MVLSLFLACSPFESSDPMWEAAPEDTVTVAVLAPSQLVAAQGSASMATGSGDTAEPVDTADPEVGLWEFWPDVDGDGFGSGEPIQAARAPEGYSSSSDDCDDADALVHPAQTGYFRDARADGTWDYDCDGVETLGWSWFGLCDADCLLEAEGWDASDLPACGEGEAWIDGCSGAGPDEVDGECQDVSDRTRIQPCR